jgi:hypothetical protein
MLHNQIQQSKTQTGQENYYSIIYSIITQYTIQLEQSTSKHNLHTNRTLNDSVNTHVNKSIVNY